MKSTMSLARLSLRPPQSEFLAKLASAIEAPFALWCKRASDHAKKIGAKPWKYLLIPHDQVTEDKRLIDYLAFEVASLA